MPRTTRRTGSPSSRRRSNSPVSSSTEDRGRGYGVSSSSSSPSRSQPPPLSQPSPSPRASRSRSRTRSTSSTNNDDDSNKTKNNKNNKKKHKNNNNNNDNNNDINNSNNNNSNNNNNNTCDIDADIPVPFVFAWVSPTFLAFFFFMWPVPLWVWYAATPSWMMLWASCHFFPVISQATIAYVVAAIELATTHIIPYVCKSTLLLLPLNLDHITSAIQPPASRVAASAAIEVVTLTSSFSVLTWEFSLSETEERYLHTAITNHPDILGWARDCYLSWCAWYIDYTHGYVSILTRYASGTLPHHLILWSCGVWLVYTVFMLTTTERDRSWPFYRRLWIWDLFGRYFPITHHNQTGLTHLDGSKKYILCMHPHGSFGLNSTLLMGGKRSLVRDLDIRMLAANAVLYIPILSDLLKWWGFVPASRHIADDMLTQGKSLIVYVGGSAESFEFERFGDVRLIVKKRKGFIRLAFRHGASIVPTFSFGQNDIYAQLHLLMDFRRWLVRVHRVLVMFFWGRFMYVPFRHPIDVYFAEPIECPQTHTPTPEQVNEVHRRYVQALEALYHDHKHLYGYEHRKLIVM